MSRQLLALCSLLLCLALIAAQSAPSENWEQGAEGSEQRRPRSPRASRGHLSNRHHRYEEQQQQQQGAEQEEEASSSSNIGSFLRSDSFKQLGQAALGGFIANQVINYDAQQRSDRTGLADHEGTNPYSAPGAIHFMAGAAVATAVADPTLVVDTAKRCFDAACRLSFRRLNLNDHQDNSNGEQEQEYGSEMDGRADDDGGTSSRRVNRSNSRKAIVQEARENRMTQSRKKKSLQRQKSIVLSSDML
jgi:hypothetical protein